MLHELTPVTSTLEDAYMALTADSVEYQTDSAQNHIGHGAAGATAGAPAPTDSLEGAQR